MKFKDTETPSVISGIFPIEWMRRATDVFRDTLHFETDAELPVWKKNGENVITNKNES